MGRKWGEGRGGEILKNVKNEYENGNENRHTHEGITLHTYTISHSQAHTHASPPPLPPHAPIHDPPSSPDPSNPCLKKSDKICSRR